LDIFTKLSKTQNWSNIYDKILEIIIANSRNFDPKLEEKKNSKLLRLQTLKELGEKKYCKFEKTN
jgi:hypothetical protein